MKKISLTIVMMLVMSILLGIPFVNEVQAATTYVAAGGSIQDTINASSAGDIIIVNSTDATTVTYFVGNVVVNKSITLRSANGSALTWINGTVNITVDDVTLGGEGKIGFTIYQSTIDATAVHAVNISTNASRDNITIRSCTIIGGYDGVHIGMAGGTANETSNLTIYNCTIRDCGKSAIYAGPGQLVTANFSLITGYNTSNTIYGDIICIDGGNDVLIYYCTLYDTTSNGGMGINSTGESNVLTNFRVDKNTIYNVSGYSPISIVSQSDAAYVENVRITFNELENNSGTYSEAAIRFDNLTGAIITATNISVFYNNINTTGNDIEEQFGGIVATYFNWTGVMKAYFNWYGSDVAGSFRNTGHQYASPRLHLGSAAGNIWTGTDYLEGTLDTDTLNATAVSDVLLELLTSTDDVVVVVYPYGLGGASNPLDTIYPVRSMHNYKEMGVSNASLITFPVNITVYYDAADLLIRGWSESRINGLVFYNATSSAWEEFNNTGKNTTYNASGYSGFVWAVAYTESQFTGAVICINYNAIIPEEEAAAVTEDEVPLDSDGDGYSDAEEIIAGSDPYDAASTPVTVAAALTFLGLDWYWWIAIIIIFIFFIIAVYFALSPKAWKKFKKAF